MSTALHLTLAEYAQMVQRGAFDHLDRKVELIRGELLEMNPAGPLHDDLLVLLTRWSFLAVDLQKTDVRVQMGLDLTTLDSCPEPDLVWVDCRRYRDQHPTAADVQLAVEVSASSLDYDLGKKAALYAAAGIVEYWIVDAGEEVVHVFRKPVQGTYSQQQLARKGEHLSPLAGCQTPLDLSQLFGAE